ncbi:MGMT family protein [Candidatus Woesearchaeota archaeon]|nr:MGMT family protein [Candidatus Woesearchaeota archaeon]
MKRTFAGKVYAAVKKIPRGKVATYKSIANQLGCEAYRAVGAALRNNPFPGAVPCHRVVRSDGSVGGYCGKKENPKKITLLKSEGIPIMNGRIADAGRFLHT